MSSLFSIKYKALHSILLLGITAFAPLVSEIDNTIGQIESGVNLESTHLFPEKYYECKRRNTEVFKPFGSSVTIDMIMTISIFTPVAPVGASLDITPFAIGPDGKIYKGDVTNIVPAGSFFQALNPVKIKHPLQGNYVVGYFVSLGAGSPIFPNAIGNFGGVILNNAVGNQTETISFPAQALFVNALSTGADYLTVTGNFPIVKK